MACNITKGRAINCSDSIGGIVAAYFSDFGAYGSITEASDAISDMDGTFTAFRYDVNGTGNSFTTTATVDKNNGTTFFQHFFELNITKIE